MIDEKDEDLTTLGNRSKRAPTKVLESTNIQNLNVKNRRNSYRGSIYC